MFDVFELKQGNEWERRFVCVPKRKHVGFITQDLVRGGAANSSASFMAPTRRSASTVVAFGPP